MKSQFWPVFFLILAPLLWGQDYSAIKIALDQLQPAEIIILRLALASLFVAPFFVVFRKHVRALTPKNLALTALMGVAGFPAFLLLLSYGQGMGTAAGIAGVLVSCNPIFNAILSRVVLGERIPPRRLVSLLVAFAGVVLVVASNASTGGGSLLGPLLIVGSAFCMALGGVVSKFVNEELPSSFSLPIAIWFGTALLLPMVPTTRLPAIVTSLTPSTWGALLFSSLACTSIAYAGWYWAFTKMPASKAGTFGYLTPVFGVAGAFFLLGETPTLLQAAGIGLVLLSIVADVLPQRAAAVPAEPVLESSGTH